MIWSQNKQKYASRKLYNIFKLRHNEDKKQTSKNLFAFWALLREHLFYV